LIEALSELVSQVSSIIVQVRGSSFFPFFSSPFLKKCALEQEGEQASSPGAAHVCDGHPKVGYDAGKERSALLFFPFFLFFSFSFWWF
jgi:hypothetical protein